MVGVGGLLVVSAQDSPADDSSTLSPSGPDPTGTGSTDGESDGDPLAPTTDAPVITISSVAPPVSVNTDDDNGDEGLVLDDFTPTDTPQPPTSIRTVPNGSVDSGQVTGALPDGYYLGYLDGIATETSIVVRFDATNGPTADAPLDDLLFVSLRVDARDPAHPGSAVVSPRTVHQLLARGDATYTIPDSDDLVIIGGTYLLTVADGRLVGIEAVS